jgi:hypothetical protein
MTDSQHASTEGVATEARGPALQKKRRKMEA